MANNLTSLAYLYSAQGKYAEAVASSKRALSIREKIWGPDDPDVAEGLSSLGRLYELEGKYTEAEPCFRRALNIMENALGKDHPFVTPDLRILQNLSWRELGIVEPPDNPHVPLTRRRMALALSMAMSLRGLATVYGTQGKYTEAEPLFKRAVAIMEKAHPGVPIVIFLEDYAVLLRKMDRYAEAVELEDRAAKLESYDKVIRAKYTGENIGK